MLLTGRVSRAHLPWMHGDLFPLAVDTDQGAGIDDLRLLSDIGKGHRIMSAVTPKKDAVVGVYRQLRIIPFFKVFFGKGPEQVPFISKEPLLPAYGFTLHTGLVMLAYFFHDRRIELRQGG